MLKPMEEGREMFVPRASTAGQQARKAPTTPSPWDNWGNPLLTALQARDYPALPFSHTRRDNVHPRRDNVHPRWEAG